MKSLPRLTPGKDYVIDGAIWNRVADFLEKADRLTVAPPLRIQDGATAKSISIQLPKRAVAGTIRVDLAVTAGTASNAGDKTTPVGFQYTATDLSGKDLGTDLDPEWPSRSENGKKVAATAGIGYFDTDGDFHIAIAFEASGTGGC